MKLTKRNLKIAWKYRGMLWKYRNAIRRRRQIGGGIVAAAGALALGMWARRRWMRPTAATAANQ